MNGARQDDESCPICGAAWPPGAAACPDCGEATDPGEPTSARDRQDRRFLLSVVQGLRVLYGITAVLFFLAAAGTAAVASREGGLAWAFAGLFGLGAAVAAAATADGSRRPWPWAVVMSLLVAPLVLLVGLGFLLAPSVPGAIQSVLFGLLAGRTWFGAFQCLRLRHLLPSLPALAAAPAPVPAAAARPRQARPAAAESQARRKVRDRVSAVEGRSRRHLLTYAGGVAGAVLLVASGIYAWMHPAPDGRVAAFRAAWNGGRWEDVRGLLDPGAQERMGKGIEVLLRRRGWDAAPPELPPPVIEEAPGGRIHARFDVAAGEVRTEWQLRDGTWVLTSVRFPER